MKILAIAVAIDVFASFSILTAPIAASPVEFISYQPSWHAGEQDVKRNTMYGTEIMRLVPYKGKLYASTSLWTESDPAIPKASQLLVLDSPDAHWKLFHQFTTRNLRLTCVQAVTEGRYYVRHVKAGAVSYELKEVTDLALPTLVSMRTMAASPFPADQGRVLYFAGYDANYQPSHNTAWIYQGILASKAPTKK